jgi:hypothetical protein
MENGKRLLPTALVFVMFLLCSACVPQPNNATVTITATQTITAEITYTLTITRVSSTDLLSIEDEAAIYAAIISSFRGHATWCAETTNPRIYVLENTDDMAGINYNTPLNVLPIAAEVQAKITDTLSDLSIGWVDGNPWNLAQFAPNGKPCSGATVVLGNIYMRSDGRMQVNNQVIYGNLGSELYSTILVDAFGNWHIAEARFRGGA